ncbi:MAG: class 3 adenylate cyclase [Gammaproteobacteria bacterium]|jgi:class 3 adenylate cyclase
MSFLEDISKVREHLKENGRISFRALKREFSLDDEGLEEIIEELVDIQQIARREEKLLAWIGEPNVVDRRSQSDKSSSSRINADPSSYTPQHLAEKILQSRAALEGERKQVTVLFADVKGSMDLAAQVGAESWHVVLDRFFSILGEGIHRYEGTINQYTGDGVMALFGAPIAHEDHAQRACYAALQLRDELRRLSVELRMEQGIDFDVRIGINSGDVVVGKIGDDLRMDYTAQGHTVGIAQRLEQLAESGHVYISEHTARLVDSYFSVTDLGKSKISGSESALGVFDLDDATQVRTRLQVSRARGLTQFVGRDDEMHLLKSALKRAQSGYGQVVGVVGDPGLGKSRLCYEFVQACRREGVAVYECHCPSHGKTIPFIPILELFRNYFDISVRDSASQARQKIAGTLVLLDSSLQNALPSLFDFLGVHDPSLTAPPAEPDARQRQLFDMVHKIVRAQSERGVAAVVMVDDLHWVDNWSNEFIGQMVEAVENSHTLVLLNFRPEYSASWSAKSYYQQLPLVPLGADAVRDLVAGLLGEHESVQALTEKIMQWTAGNPLFAEEVINTLIETQQLVGRRGSYRLTRDVTALDVPATVQAIIAARIDRLDEFEKTLLHAASVVGKEFSRALIERISGIPAAVLSSTLERLKTSDFIFETALYPTVEYSFKHPLVREVAYETQLRDKLAERHSTVALAVEELEENRIDEFASMLAYHWELAQNHDEALLWNERAAKVASGNDPVVALAHWRKVRALVDVVVPSKAVFAIGAQAVGAMMQLQWRMGISLEEAEQQFEDGSGLAEKAGDIALQATLTGGYSISLGLSSGYAKHYVSYGAKAAELADQTDDSMIQNTMRNWEAWGLLMCTRLDESAARFDEIALRIPDEPNYGAEIVFPNLHWSYLHGRSYANCIRGNIDLCKIDIRNARSSIDHRHEIRAFSDVMEFLMLFPLGEFSRSRALAQNALSVAETTMARVLAYMAMARQHWHDREFDQAESFARNSLELSEAENSCGCWRGAVLAPLIETEVATGRAESGRQRGLEAIAYCHERELYWDMPLWLALARACTVVGDQDGAVAVLDELEQIINRCNANLYRPFLHEYRSEFATKYKERWDVDTERQLAINGFTLLGAEGQLDQLKSAL